MKPTEEDDQVAKASRQAVEQAASSLEQSSQNIRRDLKFSVDDETGQMVVKVTDAGTGEVIRQMPSEEALKLAQRLDEARSLLFKAEA
ncbi:flagellar protein FlaG [Pseudomonas oryzihabitans]|uniref:flagellar protein FlaG n=1 Tax=Pseudomonas oryzihabitans TaxID=47885 RepID=UPI003D03302D